MRVNCSPARGVYSVVRFLSERDPGAGAPESRKVLSPLRHSAAGDAAGNEEEATEKSSETERQSRDSFIKNSFSGKVKTELGQKMRLPLSVGNYTIKKSDCDRKRSESREKEKEEKGGKKNEKNVK